MTGIDWGDAPTWIAGGFAAVAAFYTRSTLKSQQSQIAEQREFIAQQSANLALERQALTADLADRRSSQARQVRLSEQAHGAELNDETGQLENANQWFVTVVNGSDAPCMTSPSPSASSRPRGLRVPAGLEGSLCGFWLGPRAPSSLHRCSETQNWGAPEQCCSSKMMTESPGNSMPMSAWRRSPAEALASAGLWAWDSRCGSAAWTTRPAGGCCGCHRRLGAGRRDAGGRRGGAP